MDVNVFIADADAELLVGALPPGVGLGPDDIAALARDGQRRLWWQETPFDVFLNSTPLHEPAASRARWEVFGSTRMPFLSLDTAIFKAFFNRTKDWSDLEEMAKAGRLDVQAVRKTLVGALGETDERLRTLERLAQTGRASHENKCQSERSERRRLFHAGSEWPWAGGEAGAQRTRGTGHGYGALSSLTAYMV